jgi:hypothetical protein
MTESETCQERGRAHLPDLEVTKPEISSPILRGFQTQRSPLNGQNLSGEEGGLAPASVTCGFNRLLTEFSDRYYSSPEMPS